MIILAFDQSSRTSGYSVFEDQKLITQGTFTFTQDNMGVRLTHIRDKISSLIEQYHPDLIAFEDIQLQQNVETFKVLAHVFGIVWELAEELNIKNESILAGTWRKGLGIIGRTRPEQKKNAQRWVYNNFNLSVSEDAADAICIGAYASGIRCQKQQKNSNEDSFDWS